MARHGGIRRVVRWGGLAAAVVLAAAWGASAFAAAVYYPRSGTFVTGVSFGAVGGRFGLPRLARPIPGGWQVQPYAPEDRPSVIWMPRVRGAAPGTEVVIPLWIPWLAALGLTVWRFRADRVFSPNACPTCGYDRKGLAKAATCPECGAAAGGG